MTSSRMTDLNLRGKRVLMRVDLNVPINNGIITSDKRILAILPSIRFALQKGAKLIVFSHLGSPVEGIFNVKYSLQPVANYLSKLLNRSVPLVSNYLDKDKIEIGDGKIVLLENTRFNRGEKINCNLLARGYANLCDIFIMDAFASAHRVESSTHGVAKFVNTAAIGMLLDNELKALKRVLASPIKPMTAVVGGSKISTKLNVLKSLSKICSFIIPGGGIANTFLAAAGYPIGKSLYEKNLIGIATEIASMVKVILPKDVVVAKEISSTSKAKTKSVNDVLPDDIILDIGSESSSIYTEILDHSETILWNGPVGVFEFQQFSNGTKTLAETIAKSKAFSVAGGGDTLSAIEKYNIEKDISYTSTGGGAFLTLISGKKLPGVEILN